MENTERQARDRRRRRDGLGRGVPSGAARRAGGLDRAVCAGARPGKLARGRPDHAAFVRRSRVRPLMPAAFRAWKELEADAGETVYIRTGGVSFSPPRRRLCGPGRRQPRRAGRSPLAVVGPSLERSATRLIRCPETYDVVFEPDAGMLAAARAVALQVELARLHGGEQTRVLEQTSGPADRPRR